MTTVGDVAGGWTRLAVLGGPPAFDEPRLVGRPNVVDRAGVLRRIGEALDRCWLTNEGPLVRELEQRVADHLGVAHCLATANATIGLDLLVEALGLHGEVIVPSWTFVADAHVLARAGIRPVFVDVDPVSHGLDPDRVQEAVTDETSGILAVHLWGRGCDVRGLGRLAERHGLELVLDAAHAFACRHDGRFIGGFGRAEVFSLHATKMISAFEGGLITTNDADLAERLRLARNFGFDGEDTVAGIGTNAKMSEASAAMGLTALDGLDVVLARNRANHAAYVAGLADVPGVSVPVPVPDADSNRHYVVAEVDATEAGLSRDELVAVLRLENVGARRYFSPGCHRHEPYRTDQPRAGERLPVTEALSERVMVLPTGLAVTPEDATCVTRILAAAVARAPEVSRALGARARHGLPVLGP